MISQRTKAALAEAKRRDVRLGNPEQAKANRLEAEAHAERPLSVARARGSNLLGRVPKV